MMMVMVIPMCRNLYHKLILTNAPVERLRRNGKRSQHASLSEPARLPIGFNTMMIIFLSPGWKRAAKHRSCRRTPTATPCQWSGLPSQVQHHGCQYEDEDDYGYVGDYNDNSGTEGVAAKTIMMIGWCHITISSYHW